MTAMAVLGLAALVAAAGCKRDAPRPPHDDAAHNAAQGEILVILDRLFKASDEATSPVTVRLPTGESAQARRPRPHPLGSERPVRPPLRTDALLPISVPAAIVPEPPEAFDWAPRDAKTILVANTTGLWHVEARTGKASPWIPPPEKIRPRQLLSSPHGQVLLAEPGKAIVVDWPAGGQVFSAPSNFRLNYAFWHPDGQRVVGVLEYLNFAAEDEQIRLDAQSWNPATGEVIPLDEPPLGALAWLGAAPASAHGKWLALPRLPGMIDPFPATLMSWRDQEPEGWSPMATPGAWTDAEPGEAMDGTCVWIRRGRKGMREGILWMRYNARQQEASDIPPGTSVGTASGVAAVFPPRHLWTDGARPLSERFVRRAALSSDGGFIAFSACADAPPGGPAAEARAAVDGWTLYAADARIAYAAAAQADVAGAVAVCLERRQLFFDLLAAAWTEGASSETESLPRPDSPPTEPAQSARRIAELDSAFVEAARRALGVEADHSIASLVEIEEQLDWIGGDPDTRPGVIAALGAYFGETLVRCGRATWALEQWPPDLFTPEPDLAVSDEFAYTLHAPFSSAWHAAARRLSPAGAARDLLTDWTRPIYLVERYDRATLLALARRDEPPWNLLAGLNSSPDSSPPVAPSPRSHVQTSPHSDVQTSTRSHTLPPERWQIAATLAQLHPESPLAFVLLAESLAEAQWTGPALAAWLRAAEMDPANPEYALRAGRAAVDDQRYDMAARLFLRARALDTRGECRAQLDEYLSALNIPRDDLP